MAAMSLVDRSRSQQAIMLERRRESLGKYPAGPAPMMSTSVVDSVRDMLVMYAADIASLYYLKQRKRKYRENLNQNWTCTIVEDASNIERPKTTPCLAFFPVFSPLLPIYTYYRSI